MFGWEWKSGGMEKVSLYKFTHILLLKNDGQLIQKSDKQPKKKNQSPHLLKIKNHVPKKNQVQLKKQTNKQTKKTITPTAQKGGERERGKKKGNVLTIT